MSESNIISAVDRFRHSPEAENTALRELNPDDTAVWLEKFLMKPGLELPQVDPAEAERSLREILQMLTILTAVFISEQKPDAAATIIQQLKAGEPIPSLESKLSLVLQKLQQSSGGELTALMMQPEIESQQAA